MKKRAPRQPSIITSNQKLISKIFISLILLIPSSNDKPAKSFSLYYNDMARKFFLALSGLGGLSAFILGVPLIPIYLSTHTTDILHLILSIWSILVCIWG